MMVASNFDHQRATMDRFQSLPGDDNPNPKVRRQRRRAMFKGGRIFLHDQGTVIDCVVRDYSPRGAKLVLERKSAVPDQFKLVIPDDGTEVDCEVKWRGEGEVGVEFGAKPQTDFRNIRKLRPQPRQ